MWVHTSVNRVRDSISKESGKHADCRQGDSEAFPGPEHSTQPSLPVAALFMRTGAHLTAIAVGFKA